MFKVKDLRTLRDCESRKFTMLELSRTVNGLQSMCQWAKVEPD